MASELRLDALPEHLQTAVAAKLSTADLARMRVVSQSWKQMVANPEVRKAAFKATWGLASLQGEPRNPNFYLAAGLGHFALRLRLGPRCSLASLLVRHRTDAMALRVLNNCSSDFSLSCRAHVYVPVASRSQLLGRSATLTHDPLCRRQLAVLSDCSAPAAAAPGQQQQAGLEAGGGGEGRWDALARGHTGAAGASAAAAGGGQGAAQLGGSQREALLKKLCHQMGRGLSIDEGTAAYYLDQTGGDLKRAFSLYKDDLAWETQHPVGLLPLRERTAIPD